MEKLKLGIWNLTLSKLRGLPTDKTFADVSYTATPEDALLGQQIPGQMPHTSSSGISQRHAATARHVLILTFILAETWNSFGI